jgi:hypothetical protein
MFEYFLIGAGALILALLWDLWRDFSLRRRMRKARQRHQMRFM